MRFTIHRTITVLWSGNILVAFFICTRKISCMRYIFIIMTAVIQARWKYLGSGADMSVSCEGRLGCSNVGVWPHHRVGGQDGLVRKRVHVDSCQHATASL